MQQTILSSIKYICPGIFSVKTPWGSFPVSGYLPQDVAFLVVAYRRFDSFVVCKDRMVKRSFVILFWVLWFCFEFCVSIWFLCFCFGFCDSVLGFVILFWVLWFCFGFCDFVLGFCDSVLFLSATVEVRQCVRLSFHKRLKNSG